MTILAAVKTSTDLVIAADSKVTTVGVVGRDDKNNFIFLDQTYDYATKIITSKNDVWTVALSGQISIGDVLVRDIIENYECAMEHTSRDNQYNDLSRLVSHINSIRDETIKSSSLDKAKWLPLNLLAFTSDAEGRGVRCWNITLGQEEPSIKTILETPYVYFSGSYSHSYTLLYNYNFELVEVLSKALGFDKENISKAINEKYWPSINKINYSSMPLQDALDFASFLVKVQIVMERFVPGKSYCGGPIDLAVVHGLPKNKVSWFLGKETHYPQI